MPFRLRREFFCTHKHTFRCVHTTYQILTRLINAHKLCDCNGQATTRIVVTRVCRRTRVLARAHHTYRLHKSRCVHDVHLTLAPTAEYARSTDTRWRAVERPTSPPTPARCTRSYVHCSRLSPSHTNTECNSVCLLVTHVSNKK